jgi:DNA-binding transcriptional regulator PaaX
MKKTRRRGGGALQKKILLLLLGGIALGLSRSPAQYFRVARQIAKEWQEIDRQLLNKTIRSLYKSKLVSIKDNRDGTLTLILSDEGKRRALTYDLENMQIKQPPRWDGKWRVVMFDVPERFKKVRESLRVLFKNMAFLELQKSVFVYPYPCKSEIEYIAEFYNSRKNIRFITATSINNEVELRKHFGL